MPRRAVVVEGVNDDVAPFLASPDAGLAQVYRVAGLLSLRSRVAQRPIALKDEAANTARQNAGKSRTSD